MPLDVPKVCPTPDCGSTHLLWSFGKRLSNHAPPAGHNRLAMNDVVPRIFLACEECDEVLLVIEDDDQLDELIQPVRPIEITIQRPERKRPPWPDMPALHNTIARLIRDVGAMTTSKLAEALDQPHYKIKNATADMNNRGYIQPGDSGNGWELGATLR